MCSTYHFNKSSIKLSRIIVYKDKASAKFTPILCVSCPGMPCAKACPTNAIVKNKQTGMPEVIIEKCSSCGDCVKACPYMAIRFEPSVYAYPLICDLCGGDPQCINVCWPGALTKAMSLSEKFRGAAKARSVIAEIISKYTR
ncbi:MAG: 4Fe-4S dicluster domain-containing protein [Zestosphaera sp.]